MTEDEAKTKICCGAPYIGTVINNRPDSDLACIASACMAWRWGQKPNPSYNPSQGAMWPQPHPPVPMYVRDETTGGCGLAGAPQ